MMAEHFHRVGCREHVLTRDQEVRHRAHGVEIAASVEVVGGSNLLGRHEQRRPGDGSDGGETRVRIIGDVLDETEVQHLREVVETAALAQHDVAGLDVPMDQADRVRLGERAEDLPEDVEKSGLAVRAPRTPPGREA